MKEKTGLAKYAPFIGKRRLWRIQGVLVAVEILDVAKIFGRVDFLVAPLAPGRGKVWVTASNLTDAQ